MGQKEQKEVLENVVVHHLRWGGNGGGGCIPDPDLALVVVDLDAPPYVRLQVY